VIRVALVLLLLCVPEARAQPAGGGFDAQRMAAVYAAALDFMAPRILDPIPLSQLALWGLRGLTAIDPTVSAYAKDGKLILASQSQLLFEAPAPIDDSPASWAAIVTSMTGAGYNLSPALRRAGTQALIQGFFDALFAHLDPYSRYVPPAEARHDRTRRNGNVGIGMTVTVRGGNAVVTSVAAGGPAARAGIKPGSTILAIDRKPVHGLDARAVMALIDGSEDTELRILWRGSDRRQRERIVVRAMLPPETVFPETLANVLVVRITGFSRTTDEHLVAALRRALAPPRPVLGIVLDLRGNRGGLLRQAAATADIFLSPGIVAMTAGRAVESNFVWQSGAGGIVGLAPVIVMVDGRTASAAEILAAALADRGRAVVVGSATMGKGLVQTIDPLPDGGELFVTWSRVLAPRGWPIQELGLLPQVCTSRGEDALHSQLEMLAQGVQPMAREVAMHRAARPPLSTAQVLAIRDICPAADGSALDLEVARTLIRSPAAYVAALLPPMRDGRSGEISAR
jgi:carboxyl-terminal processing protease